jgi:hypothetical protein
MGCNEDDFTNILYHIHGQKTWTLTRAIADPGVDPKLVGRAVQDAVRSQITARRAYCSWACLRTGLCALLNLAAVVMTLAARAGV